MTALEFLKIAVYFLLILAVTKPLGLFMHRLFERTSHNGVERLVYRLTGVDAQKEHSSTQYTIAMLIFSAVGLFMTYAIERLQHLLPLNPDKMPAVAPDLAWNTAVSFTTNTNWQAYSGESTMSHFTQMAGLASHNFFSAAVGIVL
ncbi:MAG TPA: potassium-transporting ATPase subunit KdpA, partial [Thermoanaerobaculia bacterium]|nr:potassium-transporting ATPase subunit KdpA [Thermoanaerobaculia bacterium]